MSIPLGPSHDTQRFQAHHKVALVLIVVGVLALGARLLLVQYLRGDRYEKYAAIERATKIRAPAQRGLIKGADGTVLARNIESHSLEILSNRVRPERVPDIVKTLRELLDLTDDELDHLMAELARPVDPRKRRPIVVRRNLVSTHCPYDSSPLELTTERRYSFCTTCGRSYEPSPDKKACPFDQRRLVQVGDGPALHCTACERDFSSGDTCAYDGHALRHGKHILRCPLCQRSFNDEVAVLRGSLHRLPEARVVAEIQREYPYRYLASHILGYMGYASPKDMQPLLPFGPPRYGMNDRVGKAGLERALDDLLRGLDGEQVVVRRSGTEEQAKDLDDLVAALNPRAPVPGYSVRLTLDMDLQRAAKVAMKDVYSGAAVVLDAQTGAVLALYSKPSFDPNTLSGKRAPRSKSLRDITAYAPLLNKALHAFPPASTYKVITAVAALEEGLISPATTYNCPGHYDFGGRRFHCHNRKGHGEVDVTAALRGSCDVFFYKLGEQLGLERMEVWSRKLGFGEKTGIELAEAMGRVPNRAWYKDHVPGGYYPGFALSTAVGQKDVLATPLQLARIYAGIANAGHLPEVTLLAGFEEAGKLVPRPWKPGRQVELQKRTWGILRNALHAVVNEEGGTAFGAQSSLVTMAGKTGTAQAPQRVRKDVAARLSDDPGALARLTAWLQNDHAWFTGWAPADSPQIVVSVFVEHGGSGGHNAAPIARQIVDAWFSKHPLPASAMPPPRERKRKHADPAAVDPAATAPAGADPAAEGDGAPHDAESNPSLPDGDSPGESAPAGAPEPEADEGAP